MTSYGSFIGAPQVPAGTERDIPAAIFHTSMRHVCGAGGQGGSRRIFCRPRKDPGKRSESGRGYILFANPNVKCNKGTRKVVLAAPSPSRRESRGSGHDIAGL